MQTTVFVHACVNDGICLAGKHSCAATRVSRGDFVGRQRLTKLSCQQCDA